MNELFDKLFKVIIPISAVILFGFTISQLRRVTNDIINNMMKINDDALLRHKVIYALMVNIYLIFIIILLFVAVYLNVIDSIYFILAIVILIIINIIKFFTKL